MIADEKQRSKSQSQEVFSEKRSAFHKTGGKHRVGIGRRRRKPNERDLWRVEENFIKVLFLVVFVEGNGNRIIATPTQTSRTQTS